MSMYAYKDSEIADLKTYLSATASRCGTHSVPTFVVTARAKDVQAQKDISYIHNIERSGYCYRNRSRSHKVSHTHSTLMTGLEMPRLHPEPELEIKLKEKSPVRMGFKAISQEFSPFDRCLPV